MSQFSNVVLNSLPPADIVSIFRASGFDAEETRALGEAYDIACRSLHPTGPPPVVQQVLANKLSTSRSAASVILTGSRPSP